jgi:hypothetical protein
MVSLSVKVSRACPRVLVLVWMKYHMTDTLNISL